MSGLIKKSVQETQSRVLWIVSAAVFLSTSVWFTGTAAAPSLIRAWHLNDLQSSWLTISVQLGFIGGTFLYAFFNLSDVFGARRIYLISAVGGALFNGLFGLLSRDLATAVLLRFLTGITLAGIYPVAMKIIASWYRKGLGAGLGMMVGALTLGTAFPYFLAGVGSRLQWRLLIIVSSLLTVLGGAVIAFAVKDGPFLTERARFAPRMAVRVFKDRAFRLQSLGYFGHMWELYAFWALVAFYLSGVFSGLEQPRIALMVFFVIASGAVGCVAGGLLSRRVGERRVALISLWVSGFLCLAAGFVYSLPTWIVLPILLVWGFFVVADSPQFSALAALSCPQAYTGTALTIQNGIGFAVTVLSIQLLPLMAQAVGWRWAFSFLAPGPLLGAWAIIRLGGVVRKRRPCDD